MRRWRRPGACVGFPNAGPCRTREVRLRICHNCKLAMYVISPLCCMRMNTKRLTAYPGPALRPHAPLSTNLSNVLHRASAATNIPSTSGLCTGIIALPPASTHPHSKLLNPRISPTAPHKFFIALPTSKFALSPSKALLSKLVGNRSGALLFPLSWIAILLICLDRSVRLERCAKRRGVHPRTRMMRYWM